MIHYHGTPITPVSVLMTLTGKHFCVSHARRNDVARAHDIGQSVMLDNGAYTKFTRGRPTDWPDYYAWCDRWLAYPTTWAVIPDEIAAGSQAQDALLKEWPHGQRGAPVWHMNEPVERLLRLVDGWQRVCVGSTDEFWKVLSPAWCRRMDEAWNALARRHQRLPYIHMLRGMQCSGREWPFASADSTDVAQSHHDHQNTALKLADRWDRRQCPAKWTIREQAPQFQF